MAVQSDSVGDDPRLVRITMDTCNGLIKTWHSVELGSGHAGSGWARLYGVVNFVLYVAKHTGEGDCLDWIIGAAKYLREQGMMEEMDKTIHHQQ